MADRLDTEAFTARYGSKATTAEDGRVSIESDGYCRQLIARFGKLYGETTVMAWEWRNRPATEYVVTLLPRAMVQIELVDANGEPAPGLGVVFEGAEFDAQIDTDGSGVVHATDPRSDPSDIIRVRPAICGSSHDDFIEVVPDRDGRATISVPPTGSVLLKFEDFGEGDPVGGWSIWLTSNDDDGVRPVRAIRIGAGEYWVPHVALGRQFEVLTAPTKFTLKPAPPRESLSNAAFVGPREPGELREVVLRPNRSLAWLHGVAEDETGATLGHRQLYIDIRTRLRIDDEPLDFKDLIVCATGEDGGFCIPLPMVFDGQPLGALEFEALDPRGRHVGLRATRDAGTAEAGSSLRLGTVAFQQAPLLIGGTLVDRDSNPAKAEIELFELGGAHRWVSGERVRWYPGMKFRYYQVAPGPQHRWMLFVNPSARRQVNQLGQALSFLPGTAANVEIRVDTR